jgi:amidase
VSRFGVFELAASLDHAGVLARSAVDVAHVLGVIAGLDERDPTSLAEPVPDYAGASGSLHGLRIGIDRRWNSDDVCAETQQMLANAEVVLAGCGAQIIEVGFPRSDTLADDWAATCAIEAAVAHAPWFPSQREKYGQVLAGVLALGARLGAAEYQNILLRRREFCGRVARLFRDTHLLLTPVQPCGPLTWKDIRSLGEQPELVGQLQRFTCAFNMTGHPTLTLPGAAARSGMPAGFQLVGRPLDEARLLRAGAAYQRCTGWHRRHPDL